MPDIVHEFTIKAPREQVFETMATPRGLSQWRTKSSDGTLKEGAEYTLLFPSLFPSSDFTSAQSHP